jgi:hypothetical protein
VANTARKRDNGTNGIKVPFLEWAGEERNLKRCLIHTDAHKTRLKISKEKKNTGRSGTGGGREKKGSGWQVLYLFRETLIVAFGWSGGGCQASYANYCECTNARMRMIRLVVR